MKTNLRTIVKLSLTVLAIFILATPIAFIAYAVFNGFYLKYQAESLCDAITIGSTMEIDKLKDRTTIEFQNLKGLAKNYGSRSYDIYGNYVLINFNLIYMGYRCVIKTQDNIVSDKKICAFEDGDGQCFDLNL